MPPGVRWWTSDVRSRTEEDLPRSGLWKGFPSTCFAFALAITLWECSLKNCLRSSACEWGRSLAFVKAMVAIGCNCGFGCVFLVLSASQSANALPAFARKYGLRCSACHESCNAELFLARSSKTMATN